MIYILTYMYDWFPYKYKLIKFKNDDWDIIEKVDYIDYWFDSIIDI